MVLKKQYTYFDTTNCFARVRLSALMMPNPFGPEPSFHLAMISPKIKMAAVVSVLTKMPTLNSSDNNAMDRKKTLTI